LDPAHQEWMHQRASVRDRAEGGCELERRHGHALPEAVRREVDAGPRADVPEQPRLLAGQLDSASLAEAELAEALVIALLAQPVADLRRADVTRVLDRLGHREPTVPVHVVDHTVRV